MDQGGAIGALLATLIFYPFDVAKTRLQADADATVQSEKESSELSVTTEGDSASTPTTSTTSHEGEKHGGAVPCVNLATGERTYWGELRVFLRQPELWYTGLGGLRCGACFISLASLV